MLSSKISIATLVVVVVISSLFQLSVEARTTFVTSSRASFLPQERVVSVRGGATAVAEDDSDFEIESSDYGEDEEDDLVKSAQTSISKVAKKAVGSALASTKPSKKKKSSLAKLFKIPYILGAVLNPIVMAKMIKGYWASLVNLNYLKENVDTSENLRSALQEKAKKGGGSINRGKRKMRPGQAKTLSDLPQLNT